MTTRFIVSSGGRPKWTSILGLVLGAATVFSPTRVAFSQTREYIVTELTGEDAAQVPSKLNNLGDIVGRKADGGEGAPRATLWGSFPLLEGEATATSLSAPNTRSATRQNGTI